MLTIGKICDILLKINLRWYIMLKRILSVVIVMVMIASVFSFNVVADDGIIVLLNGKQLQFDVSPKIINDRTLVPMRAIFEALEFEVQWVEETRYVIGASLANNKVVAFQIENPTMFLSTVDDSKTINPIAIDVAPQIIDGRTLIPLRALADGVGATINWIEETKTIEITFNQSMHIPKMPQEFKTKKGKINIESFNVGKVENYSYTKNKMVDIEYSGIVIPITVGELEKISGETFFDDGAMLGLSKEQYKNMTISPAVGSKVLLTITINFYDNNSTYVGNKTLMQYVYVGQKFALQESFVAPDNATALTITAE